MNISHKIYKEKRTRLSDIAKRQLVALIDDGWEDMELASPPEGTKFDDYIKHYDLKFRSFEVSHTSEMRYTAIVAYINGEAFAAWGPWNGDDADDWYWETCFHCVSLLYLYKSYDRKRSR
jgi:hypothetical protein